MAPTPKPPLLFLWISVNTSLEGVRTFLPQFEDFGAIAPLCGLFPDEPLELPFGAPRREALARMARERLSRSGATLRSDPAWIEDGGREILCLCPMASGFSLSLALSLSPRQENAIPRDAFGAAVLAHLPWIEQALPGVFALPNPLKDSRQEPGAREIHSPSLGGARGFDRPLDLLRAKLLSRYRSAMAFPAARARLEALELSSVGPSAPRRSPKAL